jgi:LPS-assembly lipoprotein
MSWRNNRLALGHAVRIAAVIAIAGLNAACFQPLYASKTINGGPGLATALAQVQIDRIVAPNGTPEARVAGEVESALDFELQGGGGLISPTHKLIVRMTANRQSIITDPLTGRVEAEITGIDASYTLTELASGKTVMTGRSFSRVSSDYPGQQQRFARVRARVDAENRAAKTLAENIRTRLASYFVAGT